MALVSTLASSKPLRGFGESLDAIGEGLLKVFDGCHTVLIRRRGKLRLGGRMHAFIRDNQARLFCMSGGSAVWLTAELAPLCAGVLRSRQWSPRRPVVTQAFGPRLHRTSHL